MKLLIVGFTSNLLSLTLLGFGDSCYQTQLFAIFGSVYSDKSAAAFAIFKFTQSAASAIAFFSSSYMGILDQMITLLLLAVLGFFGIFFVEWDTKRKAIKTEESTSSESGIGTNTADGPVPAISPDSEISGTVDETSKDSK
jgi:hypothetical protein